MIPNVVSENGLNLVKKFEGLHKVTEDGDVRAYRCPAGKWTVGYGHTRGVKSGLRASVDECEKFLMEDLHEAGNAVRSAVNVPLSQNQYDALVSFVFNLGAGNFRSSTMLKKLNKGLYEEIPAQIIRWNKARVDGKLTELRGLTRRRTAEAALWAMDAPLAGQEGGDLMPQKPVQEAVKPLTKSKTLAGAGAAGIGTVGSLLGDAATNLESLVMYSESIKMVFLALTVVGIALVTYSRIKDHNEGER
jgi:GH24 family phage-related lysozyme (muramidase)